MSIQLYGQNITSLELLIARQQDPSRTGLVLVTNDAFHDSDVEHHHEAMSLGRPFVWTFGFL